MNSNITFLLAVFSLLLVPESQGKNLEPGKLKALPDFNCTDKQVGYYSHPLKCTSFVLCKDGEAYELECQHGVDNNGRTVQYHFVASSGPDPETQRCDEPTKAGCDPDPILPETTETEEIASTTEEVVVTTTQTTTTVSGKSCDPDNCQLTGYCDDYQRCDNVTSKLIDLKCGPDLFWNNFTNPIHGGVCDYYDNLPENLKQAYFNDEDCIPPCAWYQTEDQECSPEYTYRERFTGSTENRLSILTCSKAPEGLPPLFWSNDERQTCVKCSDAKFNNGTSCALSRNCLTP